MAKDPAFLFYSDNFMTGTMFFTDEQTGKYIRLLCAQHQHGRLTEKHMMHICKTYDEDIWAKFQKDENGLFYQSRLSDEIEKRKNFTESRRKNRLSTKKQTVKPKKPKNTSKTYDSSYDKHMSGHMGNGNGNGNINEIEDGNGSKKPPHPEYSKCIKVYDDFIRLRTSAPARIDGLIGRSMNEIINQLSKYEAVVENKKTVSELLQYIFEHFAEWTAYQQTQIKLNQINSNLENIINSIKNGRPKSGKNAGADELHKLAELQRRGIKIDYASMLDKKSD